MRRSSKRQKRNGDEQDWCNRWARRAYRLTRRPGIGKYNKRNLARRRRRESRRDMAEGDGEEESPSGYIERVDLPPMPPSTAQPFPINCPVCESLLKVVSKTAELLRCTCLDCGTTVVVPSGAWAKREPRD